MLKINISSEQNKYLYDRQNYFYDSTNEYVLYYIPDYYGNKIDTAVKQINKQGITSGIDSTISYMWFLPFVIVFLTIILTFFSNDKPFFLFTSILPCIYVFCNAFYASAISVVILILCLFMISNIYKRKGAVNKILKGNFLILIALIISFISSFSVSLISGIFYIILFAGTTCSVLLAVNITKTKKSKYDFNPVLILSARKIPVYGKKSGFILPSVLVSIILILAYFLLGSMNIGTAKNKEKILLPGKTEVSDSKLPLLEDYFRWNWNVITSPYKSLNNNSEYDDQHVVYPKFEVEDGIIKQKNYTIYYNQTFKEQILNNIENLDFYSIENVIKEQGSEFVAGYTKAASYNVSIFSIIMMILCFCMLLFIYFSAIIRKGGKR